MKMRIYFECVGFTTNPVFILDVEEGNASPIPYGTIVDHDGGELKYWPENYDPTMASEEEVLAAYKNIYDKCGVSCFDIGKAAWVEGRFGERKPC